MVCASVVAGATEPEKSSLNDELHAVDPNCDLSMSRLK